ncbi:Lrp/AsnC family transcriptional regulator [Marinomonas sp. 2405UD68-3]|uniref:Lrp/AsnC family transcriptional regulator n=1 Tax=Marinomonas sp. 2405UD68-3 TaxID=3391835 RepID=UPI0039C95050
MALLDAEKLNLNVSVFVQVKTNHHDKNWLELFSKTVAQFPEVIEFYRMAGEHNYLLRVLVSDIQSYHRFIRN